MPIRTELVLNNPDDPTRLMRCTTDVETTEPGPLWTGCQMVDMWVNDAGKVQYASVLHHDNQIRAHDGRGNHVLRKAFGCPIGGTVRLCDMGDWTHVSEEISSNYMSRLRGLDMESNVFGAVVHSLDPDNYLVQ